MKKFVVLGKYTKQGTDGWLDNPDEDRRAMIAGVCNKLGGNLIDMMYTRGDYDVIVMLEAPDMDTLLSLKLAMMKTGAIAERLRNTIKSLKTKWSPRDKISPFWVPG